VAVSPPSNRAEFPPVPESAVVEAERALGADGTSRRLTAPSPSEGWIRAAARADLLVVGCDALGWVADSRPAADVLLGSPRRPRRSSAA